MGHHQEMVAVRPSSLGIDQLQVIVAGERRARPGDLKVRKMPAGAGVVAGSKLWNLQDAVDRQNRDGGKFEGNSRVRMDGFEQTRVIL